MICRPGTFSQKYNTNPFPNKNSRLSKDRNKQNKNINGICQQQTSYPTNQQHNQTMPDRRSISTKKNQKSQAKLKIQLQKCQKQLTSQITKLKKQNHKLKQQNKKSNKLNQQNICSYQQYIKEIQNYRDDLLKLNQMLQSDLKLCIIWIMETFTLNQQPKNHQYLVENKFGKKKMSELFQKLSKSISYLKIQQNLIKHCQISKSKQQYLIFENDSKQQCQTRKNQLQSEDEFNNLLDTFDLRKQSFKTQQFENDNIARRLFVNEDTFANDEIGDHQISNSINANAQTNQSKQKLANSVVKVKHCHQNDSQDYLKVKIGDQIKLLRNIGNLWIAQFGNKIGYINQDNFN